ncbi:hypothetical protein SPBR_07149 [Sporothrix brasiliensis 5110]|uniref:Microbial-type PARG catalytic domain-containing protein n=1 Tax=Sporothrix brasiliensis 5110 TaxID=1398154 RepID=A0A0C2ITU1_9PEZI|nr:uncharacterized protein SPBR_07149 [Sporothrix brasiliensis 5110]KIH88437.1 hypothetical protein SPBR_07149 [Sporothrix brasiliensis 5110]
MDYRGSRGNSGNRDQDHRGFRDGGRRSRDSHRRHRRGRHDGRGPDRDGRRSHNTVPRAAYPPGQREKLREDAKQTLRILPTILEALGTSARASAVVKHDPWSLRPLDPSLCPRLARPATIRVLNSDTINAALGLQRFTHAQLLSDKLVTATPTPLRPPLVVNFASHHSPGGGWRNGALAQEEALCYRSSLSLSLDRDLYPLGREDILYSPYVLVMRSDRASGHKVMVPETRPRELPIMSVVSVAALKQPALRNVPADGSRPSDSGSGGSQGTDDWSAWATQSSGPSPPLAVVPASSPPSSISGDSTISWSPSQGASVPTGPLSEYTSQPSSPKASSQSQAQQLRSQSADLDRSDGQHSSPRGGEFVSYANAAGTVTQASTRPETRSSPPRPPPRQERGGEKTLFAYETDRFLTKLKMRLILRAAAQARHRQLVLGALGCGVYANPPEEVAQFWLEVLREPEFADAGHWWQDIVFAVYDGQLSQSGQMDLGTQPNTTNYAVFHGILDGQQV